MGMTFSDPRCISLVSEGIQEEPRICLVCGNPFRVTCRESEWVYKINVRAYRTAKKLVAVCSYHCMMTREKNAGAANRAAAWKEEYRLKLKTFDRGALMKIMGGRGISQKQLSERTGIPASSMLNYSSGWKRPSPERLVQIAAALEVEPEELIKSED